MLIGIIGENCSGKSTLAEKIGAAIGARIVTGKDYLRMAKNEGEALGLFTEKLREAVSGENLIYEISEQEHVKLLPEGAVRILVAADIETIKERFKARMHGNLPAPVAQMLERKHGVFDCGTYDYRFDGANGDAESLCLSIADRLANGGKMLAYCGLDCAKCTAYLATVNDDRALREETARTWSEWNQTEILPEQINCMGCRGEGVKSVFCDSLCGIRRCALEKGFKNCGACPEHAACETLSMITSNNPEALHNLEGSN